MIIDGRAMASEILARAKTRAAKLPHPPRILVIVGNETPATKSYLYIKQKRAADAGCVFEIRALGAMFDNADAVIVQLPLPSGLNTTDILNSIPIEQDADVLSRAAREKFERGDADALLPPVVGAMCEIFVQNKINLKRKKAVVVGKGFLVGVPAAKWLRRQGALVTIADSKTENLARLLRSADIIITGVGVPHLIKPDMVRKGVVIIDAGTSESNGALAGDASPSCAEKCSLFTPVPGGIGPLAVAKLFANTVTLAERKNSSILSS